MSLLSNQYMKLSVGLIGLLGLIISPTVLQAAESGLNYPVSFFVGEGDFDNYSGDASTFGVTYHRPLEKYQPKLTNVYLDAELSVGESDRSDFVDLGLYGAYRKPLSSEHPLVGVVRGGVVHTDLEIDNLQGSNNTWNGNGFDPAGSVGVGYHYNQRTTVNLTYRVQGSPTVDSSAGTSKPGNFSDLQLRVNLEF